LTLELAVERIAVRNFRNIEALDLEFSSRINVLSGDNGQGKTSVLEALYLAATSRSFRTEKLKEVIREGQDGAKVTSHVIEAGIRRSQRAVVTPGKKSYFIDEVRASRLGDYAVRTPVVIFHPGDLELISGSSSGRRKLLDRVALYAESGSGDARAQYQRAQKERQAALERRGINASECDVFEALMAEHGARVQRAHERAFSALQVALEAVFSAMAAPGAVLDCRFKAAGSADPTVFADQLRARRTQDLKRKGATYGPHKDEIEIDLGGRSARHHASQGQQRILSLALKLAELTCIREARGAHPILLLDDVSSELDPARTGAVYDLVRQWPSQVLVTTTRPELFETGLGSGSERRDFRLHQGALEAT
jgi:DNA replication and repair protein RecF